jgi:hypothetical protein
MTRVKQKVLTLVVAAGLLGLGYRQASPNISSGLGDADLSGASGKDWL